MSVYCLNIPAERLDLVDVLASAENPLPWGGRMKKDPRIHPTSVGPVHHYEFFTKMPVLEIHKAAWALSKDITIYGPMKFDRFRVGPGRRPVPGQWRLAGSVIKYEDIPE